jgi:predicted PurR-regulated permease PerM
MLDRLSPQRRNTALAVLTLLAVLAAWQVRAILNPLVAGYVLAYIAQPLVLKLERRGWSRLRAVNTIYFLFAVFSVLMGLVAWSQGSLLAERVLDPELGLIPTLDARLGSFIEANRGSAWLDWLFDDPDGSARVVGLGEGSTLALLAQQLWLEFGAGREGDVAAQGAGVLSHWFGSAVGLVSMLVLLPIYAWYLLFELDRIHAGVRKYVPAPEQERVARIAQRIGEVLTVFFRGRLTVCLIKGVMLTVGLWLVGAPYAVFLGMASGFAALIPFVGAFLGYAFTYLVALTSPGAEFLVTFGLISVVFAIAEVLEGYFLVPRILGDSLGLHPLFVFVAVFIGGATMGMFGFLLAVPLAASGLILVRELVVPAMEQFAAADDVPPAKEEEKEEEPTP